MTDTESTETLCESDDNTQGNTSEPTTSTLLVKDICWKLMNKIDRLSDLKEDVDGLASVTLSLDKEIASPIPPQEDYEPKVCLPPSL